MKKIIHYKIVLLGLLAFTLGCSKVLDKKPLDIISDDNVWSDPNLMNAYVVNLYSRSHMTGIFGDILFNSNPEMPCEEISISDEGRINYDFVNPLFEQGLVNNTGGELEYWDYSLIRDANTFLVKIKTAKADDDTKKVLIGQVMFLRAYAYFELVKRYGGVPLITIPQSINGGDSLYVKRNSEKEIYEFIGADCDTSASLLPANYAPDGTGRATKYAALALKSRAMMYAASIAEYGTVQLNGLLGIPSGNANTYWQQSLDASKAIIDAGVFQLYNNNPGDKAANYQMIFLDKNNSEIILAKKYLSIQSGNLCDDYYETNANYSYWGTMYSPTLEMVNAYENIDSSAGTIDWANVTGDLTQILKNKDPRLQASILYNGQPWVKDTVRIWKGIYSGGVLYNSESQQLNGMNQVGRDQQTTQGPHTGFQMKKFLNPTVQYPAPYQSDQDWIVFRYAEILLNYAEASVELGNSNDALTAINEIRSRAGISPLSSVTLNQVRHERQVELAFETHRFWDLKRWRTASTVLNAQFHGAFPYYDADHQRFFYKVDNCEAFTRVFKDAYYYFPITPDRINNNPNLVENPGY